MADEQQTKTLIDNRKARFEYFLDKEIEAGAVLTGPQVKTLLAGKATFSGNSWYVRMQDNEAFLEGLHFPAQTEHAQGLFSSNRPVVPSIKLLLHKAEIQKINDAVKLKGMTIVPVRITYKKKIKVVIALAKGKNNIDKRETVKARDISRMQAE